ncbi:MAG TPA: 50S ribosomal protein L14 [Candidatus Absconditabacterales bacterium]|nr:50S ribosomal protein L14 [Candidatus Absconditabacterales bacterium]HNG96746.1 50S ribosomal protein L14 [Candidatus Absconditabacterales bacterium]
MIQHESIVVVADNTGVTQGLVIGILKGNSKSAGIGDIVTIAYKKVSSSSTFKKAGVGRAMVVRTVNNIKRADGSYISFEDNAVILVDNKKEPLGKRIFGPVAKELREKFGYKAIAAMAQEII